MRDGLKGTLALLILVMQNTALVFLMKYSYRTQAAAYSEASVVVMSEIVKLAVCSLLVVQVESGFPRYVELLREIPQNVILCIPSALYVLQNNLLFYAVHALTPTVYVVCTQFKIITTAAFSVYLLGTTLKYTQYVALLQLLLGMILVQHKGYSTETNLQGNDAVGLACVLVASCTSGFAGVFLEKNFKSTSISVWQRNIQLCCWSLPISSIAAALQAHKSGRPFFAGYDAIVVGVIALQALGGLVTAAIMRYSTTILKCFAVSFSTCLCAMISTGIGQDTLTSARVGGIILVNMAIFQFSKN